MSEFEALLARYKTVKERYVKYKISNRHDAEDIIQEIYLAAYRGFRNLKNTDNFKAWMLGKLTPNMWKIFLD